MFKRSGIILTGIIFMVAIAGAEPLVLSDAVNEALRQNPEIISAKAEWESAKARVSQSLSLDDPKLGLEYDQIPPGSRNLEDGMKMYTFEQMTRFPGKIAAEYSMSANEAEVAGARYQGKMREITAQLKSAYYDLFLVDRSIETLAGIAGILSSIKKTTESKYITGNAAQSDILQANIEYLLMDNELTTLKQEREVKELKLKALMAYRGEAEIETTSATGLPETIESESAFEESARKNNPELLAAKAELGARDYAHLSSKMGYFPDTTLGVKKRVGGGWDAMISFSVPVYFWKQRYGVASAGFEREAAEADYRNLANMLRWEVKEAYVRTDAFRRTAKLYSESVLPQSAQALKVGLAAYKTGKIDFQSLMQIEKMYKEARLKYYENQANYGKALAELEKLTAKELY